MSASVEPTAGDVNPLLGLGGDTPLEAVSHVPGSTAYMDRARRVIPRGLASRGRLRAVPVAFESGRDAYLFDVDGNRYVDCVMALGPLLLGHSPQEVIEAVTAQLSRGLQFGGQHEGEAELAERVVRTVPCAEKVVFSNTGSEAVQAAVRIARATTKRRLIVKFDGHYHGWIDPLFVNSPGVPAAAQAPVPLEVTHNVPGQPAPEDVVVCPWNDLEAIGELLARIGEQVAAVIMEPIPFNLGTFLPQDGYLEGVRRLCRRHGALLIFDEVVSGFRVALGGAQELLGVTPDLAIYAKGVAAGLPLALVVGTDEAMASAVDGPVVHGGTYNATPMAVAAALAAIEYLERRSPAVYEQLDEAGARLAQGLRALGVRHGVPLVANQVGSLVQLLWAPREPMRNYADVSLADPAPIAELCERVLADGVYAAPRGLLFLSTAHSAQDVDHIIDAYDNALQRRASAAR